MAYGYLMLCTSTFILYFCLCFLIVLIYVVFIRRKWYFTKKCTDQQKYIIKAAMISRWMATEMSPGKWIDRAKVTIDIPTTEKWRTTFFIISNVATRNCVSSRSMHVVFHFWCLNRFCIPNICTHSINHKIRIVAKRGKRNSYGIHS